VSSWVGLRIALNLESGGGGGFGPLSWSNCLKSVENFIGVGYYTKTEVPEQLCGGVTKFKK